MTRWIVLLLLTLIAHSSAMASDYAREKRWAEQTVPDIFVGEAVYLEAQRHKFLTLYTKAENAKSAVIVVHGLGVHPNWRLIGELRRGLADKGYSTLSIQMPVLAADAEPQDYFATFPEADARILAAITYLQKQGYRQVALVSHSMGSRMSDHFFAQHPDNPIKVWVCIGMPVAFTGLQKAKPVVLDLYGDADFKSVKGGAPQRAKASAHLPGSRQIMAKDSDHFFNDREAVLLKHVGDFLKANMQAATP